MKRRAFVESVAAAGLAAGIGLPRPEVTGSAVRRVGRLDTGWKFLRQEAPGAERPGFDDSAWETVSLPHTARVEALVTGPPGTPGAIWQGTCWYRRVLRVERVEPDEIALLRFDGAMNVAEVWLDGERVGGHQGGYLPFVLDISGRLQPGRSHVLAVRLDNRDNPVTGPKPQAQLDYNIYHGLYRPVFLVRKSGLHITDLVSPGVPAGGGVFVTFPRASSQGATVRVQVQVRNAHPVARRCALRVTLRHQDGRRVATGISEPELLSPGADRTVVQELEVSRPRLWSPASPDLYTLECEVMAGSVVADREALRTGIRRIRISRDGFEINGEKLFLRGANRHQEYPYIGYALSDDAQYRDARKIKEAGFDYVRLSHYAHSPAFMDACDELGLVVMNCIPGWQFFNPDPDFVELQYRNCRDLLRRDRNHPCVVLWEVSLNESAMTPDFIARTHAIAHEEYPGDQCYTAGWMHGYDVFLDARQHGGCRAEQHRPCLVSEYGDWEYYAMNAGLDQAAWQDLTPAESNSRQLRWQGERALLQQATNFQEAHNDNRATVALGDGLWVMYDYNRGYSPDIESSGCADIFRVPKYSYHFFRSQRGPASGPMVFIASSWTPRSTTDVRVFSNCDEVELFLNGRLVERRTPDQDRISGRIAHPPFTFPVGAFEPGILKAVGHWNGRRAEHQVRTPGPIARLHLAFDLSERRPDLRRKDTIFCRARLEDGHGTVVPDAWENVAFGITGRGSRLIGMNPIASEAGIATILVETEPGADIPAVYAVALAGGGAPLSAAARWAGEPPAYQVRPPRPGGAVELLVGDRVVVALAPDAPRFRIPVSAPPEKRDPFRR